MCTGSCSRFIGIALYVLTAVSIICNIILFFPDFSIKFSQDDHITEEVKYMGGLIGGGIIVLIPAIHIHLTSSKGCCNNRCGMFLSIGFAAAGVSGAVYSMSTAALGLANGPLCLWENSENPNPTWGTPFYGNGSYLENTDWWEWCQEPKNVVQFNLTLFSILLVVAGVELVLCLIQMVNGLFGCLCGTCSGDKTEGQADMVPAGLKQQAGEVRTKPWAGPDGTGTGIPWPETGDCRDAGGGVCGCGDADDGPLPIR
ncbi:unnamed protein product [Merluccius merluccius]